MMHSLTVAFPLFLQTHYIINIAAVKKFYVLDLFLFDRENATLFGPVFIRMTRMYVHSCLWLFKQQLENKILAFYAKYKQYSSHLFVNLLYKLFAV